MNVADGYAQLQQQSLQQLCLTPHEFVMAGQGENARTGILLIHGLTGTPAEMRLLGKGGIDACEAAYEAASRTADLSNEQER